MNNPGCFKNLLGAVAVSVVICGTVHYLHPPVDAPHGWPRSITPDQRQKIDSMSDKQKMALAYAARAAGESLKNHTAAIADYRLAILEDPDSRENKSALAVELWRANRTPEAIPIWKQLAAGNDDIARQAAKWLTKTAKATTKP